MEKLMLLVVLLGIADASHGGLRPLQCFADVEDPILQCKPFYHSEIDVSRSESAYRCVRVPDDGCSTSDNGFFTKEDCQSACDVAEPPAACFAALKSVPCKRSYFDRVQNKCITEPKSTKKCLFGANAWLDADTCKSTCVRSPKCSAGWLVRTCEVSYAVMSGGSFDRCVKLDRGKCAGGRNSFINRIDCMNTCDVENPPEKCSVEAEIKDCNYFYFSDGKCSTQGRKCVFGSNAFQTQVDCLNCFEPGIRSPSR